MRVVRRILITVCVLAALCALVVYPLSYRNRLFVGWQRMRQGAAPDCRSVELFVTRGSVGVEVYARDTFWVSSFQLTPPEWWGRDGFYAGTARAYPVSAFSPVESFDAMGFHVHHDHQPGSYAAAVLGHTIVAVPLWLIVILTSAHATFVLRHRRRDKRSAVSRCPDCGYDVRATPDRCPECGRNISPASSTISAS